MSIEFKKLIGKSLNDLTFNVDDDKITFYLTNGEMWQLYADYPKRVLDYNIYIYDVIGNLEHIIGSQIIRAEEELNAQWPKDVSFIAHGRYFSWTFYRISTINGGVIIRWLCESKDGYSGRVSFKKIRF